MTPLVSFNTEDVSPAAPGTQYDADPTMDPSSLRSVPLSLVFASLFQSAITAVSCGIFGSEYPPREKQQIHAIYGKVLPE